MQLPQVFVFTGLSSPLVQSFIILLLFAGSLSTVPVEVPAEKPLTGNATSFPFVFLETNARRFAPAALDQQKKLIRSIRSDSEVADLQNSNVSKAEATVDFDQGDASPQNESAPGISTEYNVSVSTTTASIPNVVSSAQESINASSNVDVTVESTSVNYSSSPSSPTTTTTSTITTTVTTEAAMTMMETTVKLTTIPPTAAPQTDPLEITTTTALIEDKGGMPTGVIAMVTMITFIIIAVVGYVSLIVWRRYLEYRYGNRELLVNDLEFDTNDLRHFEL